MDWKAFWNDSTQVRDADFCRQVGRTLNRAPYSERELESLVSRIATSLDASQEKSLLDLACGNGLVTSRLASHFRKVTAVDFSVALLSTAKEHFWRDNIEYVLGDARQLDMLTGQYDCVLLSAALQHFNADEVDRLLQQLKGFVRPSGRCLLGDVPDRERIWNFYRGVGGRFKYVFDLIKDEPVIGSWWRPSTLRQLANANGWTVSISYQPVDCPNHYFRYDAVLELRTA